MKKNIIVLFVFLLLSVCYSQQMQIPIHFEKNSTTIELYNIKGQKILSQEFSKYTNVPFLLSNNLSNQVYIMRIKNGSNNFTRKFTPNNKIQFTGAFSNKQTKKIRSGEEWLDSALLENLHSPYKMQNQRGLRSAAGETEKPDPALDSVTKIVFINGMRNDQKTAQDYRLAIERAYKSKLKDYPGKYDFKLWYNKRNGVFGVLDLPEVLGQLADEIVKTNDVTALDLKNKAKECFANKQRLIIFAHSQGNIYANNLVDSFSGKEKWHTAALNIAPPTGKTSTGWYFTNDNDKVINWARDKYKNLNILPGFLNYKKEMPADLLENYHGFLDSYFQEGLISRREIDTEFFKQCKALPFWEVEKKDSTSQDPASQDTTFQDSTSKDSTSKDSTYYDSTSQNPIYYDSTEYIFTYISHHSLATDMLELLLNDGNYVFLGSYVGERVYPNKTTIVSNVAFLDGNPVVRITSYGAGSAFSYEPGMTELISSENGVLMYRFSDTYTIWSLEDGEYSIAPVKK